MRFAFKTAPQHTTWPAMLDVFRAADDIDVFESGWTFDHFSSGEGNYPSANTSSQAIRSGERDDVSQRVVAEG